MLHRWSAAGFVINLSSSAPPSERNSRDLHTECNTLEHRTVREPRGGADPSIDSACDSAERGAGERPSALPLPGRAEDGLGAEASAAAAASAASCAASAESATRLGACGPCRKPRSVRKAYHRHRDHAQVRT